MKQKLEGWMEGEGAKRIFLEIKGEIWQVKEMEKIEDTPHSHFSDKDTEKCRMQRRSK